MLADAGYQSKSNLEMLEQTSIEGYIATGRQKDLDQARFPSCDTAVAGSRKS